MFSQLTYDIKEAARGAGKIMREASEIAAATHEKDGFKNLVTEYDRRVQEYLFARLGKRLPEARFLGEEEGEDAFRAEYRKGWLFVIDPIDGTSNFIKGYRPSVTSIGLFRDGKPYIGVVYDPYRDEMFAAEKGCGAELNGREIHTSGDPLAKSLVSMGTAPYYADEVIRSAFETGIYYMKKCIDIRRSGSAAADLCYVACGRLGLYFEPYLQLWDYAAGALILTEAGGRFTDYSGNEVPFDGPTGVVAASAGVAGEKYLPPVL